MQEKFTVKGKKLILGLQICDRYYCWHQPLINTQLAHCPSCQRLSVGLSHHRLFQLSVDTGNVAKVVKTTKLCRPWKRLSVDDLRQEVIFSASGVYDILALYKLDLLLLVLFFYFLAHWYFIPRDVKTKQIGEILGMVILRTRKLKMS